MATAFTKNTGYPKDYGNHLDAAALNRAILQSDIVICRSGYTSIMDLIKLDQKTILIPTPGQTEQEYLAAYLMQRKIFFSVPQNIFSLPAALNGITNFPFSTIDAKQDKYKEVIKEFVQQQFSKRII